MASFADYLTGRRTPRFQPPTSFLQRNPFMNGGAPAGQLPAASYAPSFAQSQPAGQAMLPPIPQYQQTLGGQDQVNPFLQLLTGGGQQGGAHVMFPWQLQPQPEPELTFQLGANGQPMQRGGAGGGQMQLPFSQQFMQQRGWQNPYTRRRAGPPLALQTLGGGLPYSHRLTQPYSMQRF